MSPLENHAQNLAQQKQSSDPELIYVLACYYYDAQQMPETSQWNDCSLRRLIEASLLYRQSKAPIYLTGGKFNKFSDADYASAAKRFLVLNGVDIDDIFAIAEGTNTASELNSFARYLAKSEHNNYAINIITSASHVYRVSILLDSKLAERTRFHPVDFQNVMPFNFDLSSPNINNLTRSRAAMYEYAAIVRAKVSK